MIDITGGWTSLDRTTPWDAETLVNAFSVGKGTLAILLAIATSANRLDPDSPVGELWPELELHGVGGLNMREVSAHRAGLPALRTFMHPDDLFDWETMCDSLACESPWWLPGTAHGYHVNTYGFLVGNLLLRAHAKAASELLRPLVGQVGDQMYFGVPTSSLHRVADLVWDHPSSDEESAPVPPAQMAKRSMADLAYRNPSNFSGVGAVNTTRWRAAVHPSTSMHASARGVCLSYEAMLDPELVAPSVLGDATVTVSDGDDMVLGSRTRFGTGFQLPTPGRGFGPNERALGHYGAGGSLGFCDPGIGLSFGYVTNTMGQGWVNERNKALVAAVYGCL